MCMLWGILKVDTECCTLSFISVLLCSFQTLEWFYIFCVLGSVYLLCPFKPQDVGIYPIYTSILHLHEGLESCI